MLGVHLPAVEDIDERVASVPLWVGVVLQRISAQHVADQGGEVAVDHGGGHQGEQLGFHYTQRHLNRY